MSIEYTTIFLFQVGMGLAHMILGIVLFLNQFAFYYLFLGIYPAVMIAFAGLLLAIWCYGNKQGNTSTIRLRFASADQIAQYMQPLITIIILNAALAGSAFYLYTITPVAPYNSGFSTLLFTVGAIIFSQCKVPPRSPKKKVDETIVQTTPLGVTNCEVSYNDNIYKIGSDEYAYPSTPYKAAGMENRVITENAFSI